MTRLARLLLRAVRFENVKPNASFPMLGRKWLATPYVPQSHLGVLRRSISQEKRHGEPPLMTLPCLQTAKRQSDREKVRIAQIATCPSRC